MKVGIMFDNERPIDAVVDQVARLHEAGFDSAWTSQIFGFDALTMLAVVGREVPDIPLGTAVVPIYPRHPVMLAAQALTVQAAIGDRLTLGIGLSHQLVIETVFGMSFERPASYMREYLSILAPLLEGDAAAFAGVALRATTFGPLGVAAPRPSLVVAALGTTMLTMAGQMADGTATWMTGEKTVASHIVPTINEAAEAAGRPAPRVICALPVCVTDDVAAARETAGQTFAIYGSLPSYRAMLDREGAEAPPDVCIIGGAGEVAERIGRLAEGGVTDFVGVPFGGEGMTRPTLEVLAEIPRG